MPKGFLPTQDTGIIRVRTVTLPNISFAAMETIQRTVAAVIEADPAVADVASYIGNSVMSVGTMLVSLKPLESRKEPVDAVIVRLRQKLSHVPSVRAFLTPGTRHQRRRGVGGGSLSILPHLAQ